jgi:hypothetical protein
MFRRMISFSNMSAVRGLRRAVFILALDHFVRADHHVNQFIITCPRNALICDLLVQRKSNYENGFPLIRQAPGEQVRATYRVQAVSPLCLLRDFDNAECTDRSTPCRAQPRDEAAPRVRTTHLLSRCRTYSATAAIESDSRDEDHIEWLRFDIFRCGFLRLAEWLMSCMYRTERTILTSNFFHPLLPIKPNATSIRNTPLVTGTSFEVLPSIQSQHPHVVFRSGGSMSVCSTWLGHGRGYNRNIKRDVCRRKR